MRAFLPVLLLLLYAAPAAAQPVVRLYGHGGVTAPMRPTEFGDFWNAGYHLGGGLGVVVVGDWEVVFAAAYHRLTLDRARFVAEGEALGVRLAVEGGATRLASGSVRLKYNLEAGRWFAPYLVGGLGVHRRSIEDLSIQEIGGEDAYYLPAAQVEDFTAMGLELGAGVGYGLSERVKVFVEPNYVLVFGEEDRVHYLPVKFGLVWGR